MEQKVDTGRVGGYSGGGGGGAGAGSGAHTDQGVRRCKTPANYSPSLVAAADRLLAAKLDLKKLDEKAKKAKKAKKKKKTCS